MKKPTLNVMLLGVNTALGRAHGAAQPRGQAALWVTAVLAFALGGGVAAAVLLGSSASTAPSSELFLGVGLGSAGVVILLAIVRKMGTMAGGFQLESFDSSDQLDRLGRPTRHGYTDPIHRTEKREIRAEKKAKRRERYPSIDVQASGSDAGQLSP